MRTQLVISLCALSFLTSTYSLAETTAPWLKIGTEINFDVLASSVDNYERNLRFEDAAINFELLIREGIRIFIEADISEKLNKETSGERLELGDVFEEAFIRIETDKISKLPRAIITFGKHPAAFGLKYTELPFYKDSLFFKLTRQSEVIGLTVELPDNFFKLVDSAALSVFETGSGDFKISSEKGASLRLRKIFSENLSTQISALIKQNAGSDRTEKRGSVGFILQSKDGTKKLWSEGVVTQYKPGYKDETLAWQVGASKQWGPGTIVINFEYIVDQAQEWAIAYNLPVGSYLVISPEIRRRNAIHENFEDETVIGIRARLEAEKEIRHQLRSGKKRK